MDIKVCTETLMHEAVILSESQDHQRKIHYACEQPEWEPPEAAAQSLSWSCGQSAEVCINNVTGVKSAPSMQAVSTLAP